MATRIAHLREATTPQGLALSLSDGFYSSAKRVMDLTIALLALIVLFPVMALIALAIVLDSPGPAIFRQKRVLGEQPLGAGRPEERTFEFLKFRTMYHNADQMVHQRYMHSLINGQAACGQQGLYKLGNDPRITRVGRFLRKTSLDELPQLVNVLCGEMSLVGPRPAIPYEVQQYKPWHLVRLSVKQGLTGLWQVTGRNHLTFDEMVQADIAYAQSRSLLMDIKIILATIPALLSGRGAT